MQKGEICIPLNWRFDSLYAMLLYASILAFLRAEVKFFPVPELPGDFWKLENSKRSMHVNAGGLIC